MAAATGYSTQGHLQWAAHQGAYWLVYLSSTQSLSALYCTSATQSSASWTAPSGSPFTLTAVHGSEGRNFGFGYDDLSSTDVLHMSSAYPAGPGGGEPNCYHARFTLGTTWSRTNAEAEVGGGTTPSTIYSYTGGNTVVLDSNNRPIDASSFFNNESGACVSLARATNTDSGSSWTAGFGTPTLTLYDTTTAANTSALFSLGSGDALAIADNGSSNGPNQFNNLQYSKYTSSWSSYGTVFTSALTAASSEARGGVAVTTSNIVVMALSDGSSNYLPRSYNGSSWSTLTSPGSLAYGTDSGISLVSDGTNVWAAVIDTSKNIQYNKWNGTSWGGWTVLEATRSNTPAYITGIYSSTNNQIMWVWTESTGSNYNIVGSVLSTTAPEIVFPPYPSLPAAFFCM